MEKKILFTTAGRLFVKPRRSGKVTRKKESEERLFQMRSHSTFSIIELVTILLITVGVKMSFPFSNGSSNDILMKHARIARETCAPSI